MICLCAGLRVGRYYKKLSPVVACHQELLDKFLDDFWDYSVSQSHRIHPTRLRHPPRLRGGVLLLYFTGVGKAILPRLTRWTEILLVSKPKMRIVCPQAVFATQPQPLPQNKQHQLTHHQLSLIVTGQVNQLTYVHKQ
jgi:hypothetical protein